MKRKIKKMMKLERFQLTTKRRMDLQRKTESKDDKKENSEKSKR